MKNTALINQFITTYNANAKVLKALSGSVVVSDLIDLSEKTVSLIKKLGGTEEEKERALKIVCDHNYVEASV
ncbi:MAG: hypothetical protein ACJAS1_001612 [Oleiphilaceae bacterium]|jgi:hypothetical protein